MSYQKQQKTLTQEQSKIFDNLPWGEEKVKWFESKAGNKYPKKWKECSFEQAPEEAQQIFIQLGVEEKERLRSYSGIYEYGVGRDRFFQSKPYTPKTRTPEEQAQLQSDRAGLAGTTRQTVDWDKIHTRQEERDKEYEQRHQETQILNRALLDTIALLIQEIKGWREDENRRERNKLGQQQGGV